MCHEKAGNRFGISRSSAADAGAELGSTGAGSSTSAAAYYPLASGLDAAQILRTNNGLFGYDILGKTLIGEDCDLRGYHHDYEDERCYRRASPPL